jgi:hypothetical protein
VAARLEQGPEVVDVALGLADEQRQLLSPLRAIRSASWAIASLDLGSSAPAALFFNGWEIF